MVVNAAKNYTKPKMRKNLVAKVKAGRKSHTFLVMVHLMVRMG